MLQRVLFRLLFSLFVLVRAAHGCGCLAIDGQEAFKKADVVFRGTVTDIHEAKHDLIGAVLEPPKRVAVIQVDRVWKGAVSKIFELPLQATSRNQPCASWEYEVFSVGNEVLVYAHRSQTSGEYVTGNCSHTGLVKDSGGDIKHLGLGKSPISFGFTQRWR